MKSYIVPFALTLLLTAGAYAQSPGNTSSSPMPREYRPNDGTARPGNPGTFTSDKKWQKEKFKIQEQQQEPGHNLQESSRKSESEILDPSTTPDSYRVMPDGNKVRLKGE